MRVLGGFMVGLFVGAWVGAVAAVMVIETVGRAVVLPPKIVVPDYVPEALVSDR